MPPEQERLRLFVACELPSAVRDGLAAIQRDLQAGGADGLRWVRPEGIHITLKFLGEVAAGRLPAIKARLAQAIASPLTIHLRPAAVGSFGSRTGLRVVWVGLAGDLAALAGVAESVDAAMSGLGFDAERRPFKPHLTLARVREDATPHQRARLTELLARYEPPALPAFTVDHIVLMRSRIGPGGAVYSRLAAFPEPGGRDASA